MIVAVIGAGLGAVGACLMWNWIYAIGSRVIPDDVHASMEGTVTVWGMMAGAVSGFALAVLPGELPAAGLFLLHPLSVMAGGIAGGATYWKDGLIAYFVPHAVVVIGCALYATLLGVKRVGCFRCRVITLVFGLTGGVICVNLAIFTSVNSESPFLNVGVKPANINNTGEQIEFYLNGNLVYSKQLPSGMSFLAHEHVVRCFEFAVPALVGFVLGICGSKLLFVFLKTKRGFEKSARTT